MYYNTYLYTVYYRNSMLTVVRCLSIRDVYAQYSNVCMAATYLIRLYARCTLLIICAVCKKVCTVL